MSPRSQIGTSFLQPIRALLKHGESRGAVPGSASWLASHPLCLKRLCQTLTCQSHLDQARKHATEQKQKCVCLASKTGFTSIPTLTPLATAVSLGWKIPELPTSVLTFDFSKCLGPTLPPLLLLQLGLEHGREGRALCSAREFQQPLGEGVAFI